MIRKTFVNRANELSSLKSSHSRDGFEFIVITGRRRVGKTRLLQEFSDDEKTLFLMCEERKWQYNLEKFNKAIGDFFEMPVPNFDSFRECFEFIAERDDNLLIIIDEFSYLIKGKDKEILGEFQGIVDEILQDRDLTLILSGSAVSMMKKRVLGKKSPLYGRTTSQLDLQPLRFEDLLEWFKDTDIENIIKIFGICDGIPKYLEFFEGKNIQEEIKKNIFSPDAFLFREPKLLLEEELREPETYYQILEGISLGHTRPTDIANYSYMNPKDISSYLSILRDLGFIKKERSILSKRRKRGLYKIKDNFFNFWFRFVSPHFAEIENWMNESAVNEFKRDFDQYLGKIYEEVCKQLLSSTTNYAKIGRWWYKEDEIDIVALDRDEDKILLAECKWSKNRVDTDLLYDLKEKAEKVRWKNDERHEEYFLFSRSGFTDELEQCSSGSDNIALYSLQDMYKEFETR